MPVEAEPAVIDNLIGHIERDANGELLRVIGRRF